MGEAAVDRDARSVLVQLSALAWILALGLVIVTVAAAALPFSALASAGRLVTPGQAAAVLPQGWGFFTRDPQESRVLLFRSDDGESWTPAGLGQNSQAKYFFGLSREPRVQGIELGHLRSGVPEEAWVDCEARSTAECVDRAALVEGTALVENSDPTPTLCGRVVMVERAPVPWAWRDSVTEDEMSGRASALDVACVRRDDA
jgi:antimicrobial peptide system SdpA family protein